METLVASDASKAHTFWWILGYYLHRYFSWLVVFCVYLFGGLCPIQIQIQIRLNWKLSRTRKAVCLGILAL